MKHPRVSKDLLPVQEFGQDPQSWIGKPAETGRPLVLTQGGKAAAVLVSPRMLDEIEEHSDVVQEILLGLRDVAAGNLVENEAVWAEAQAVLDRRVSR